MSVACVSSAWVRRGVLAAVLAGAVFIPGHAFGLAAHDCTASCGSAGTIRWTRPLAGSWIAKGGVAGTVPSLGGAYAAASGQVAAVGFGLTVEAFQASTGAPLWTTTPAGFPAGSSIVSVRVWPGTVTVGVSFPRAAAGATARREVVLRASTGGEIRRYRAAPYGGAVAATRASTVVVGPKSVTSYDNATGQAIWNRPTGRVPQAWRVDQGELFITVAAGGYLGTAPVTALRRINLKSGAEQMIRPAGGHFAGKLSGAFDGVVLFSGSGGLTAYGGATGQLRWQLPGALPENVDSGSNRLYVTSGSGLTGVDPQTGVRIGRRSRGSSGLYGIRRGMALGLDLGALGDAWGYDIATRRVIWTTPPVPWPHYFVDLSGIGGSADPGSSTVLLSSCARLGTVSAGQSAQSGKVCLRPELVAIVR